MVIFHSYVSLPEGTIQPSPLKTAWLIKQAAQTWALPRSREAQNKARNQASLIYGKPWKTHGFTMGGFEMI